MQGGCGFARENGAAAGLQDLQAVCDLDVSSDSCLAFQNQNQAQADTVAQNWIWTSDGANEARLRYNGTNRYIYTTGGSGFYPNTVGTQALGGPTRPWQRGHFNHQVGGVASVGDASFTLDDETFVTCIALTANRTLTLPAAAAGWWYEIEASTLGAWSVSIDDQPGDTINGGAGPVVLVPAGAPLARLYRVFAEDGTDWRLWQIG